MSDAQHTKVYPTAELAEFLNDAAEALRERGITISSVSTQRAVRTDSGDVETSAGFWLSRATPARRRQQ